MIEYDEFCFKPLEEPLRDNMILLDNIKKVSKSKVMLEIKNTGVYITYRVYTIQTDKIKICKIWDKSVNNIFERAVRCCLTKKCALSVISIENIQNKWWGGTENNEKIPVVDDMIPVFTSENTISRVELNGIKVSGNYFALVCSQEKKIFI